MSLSDDNAPLSVLIVSMQHIYVYVNVWDFTLQLLVSRYLILLLTAVNRKTEVLEINMEF
jgi:hypothetical protein